MSKLKHKKIKLFYWLFFEASLGLLFFSQLVLAQKPTVAFKHYSVQDGLSHNYIRDIVQDAEGLIWIATEDGLNKFDGYTFQVYRSIAEDSTSISDHPILALEKDSEQHIWIGTWGGGVFIYNKRLDNFRRIQHKEGQSNGISSNRIEDIFKDSDGRIWIGSDMGLDMYDPKQQKFFHYKHNSEDANSLSHNRVMSITEGQDGMLWVGTLGGGLNRFDPETGEFIRFQHEEGNEHSLSGNDVFRVFFDSKQRLWVGTWGSGLNLMDRGTNQFTRFKHDPNDELGLKNNEIWSIAETDDGRIWIGTDQGLALYNEEQKNFYVFEHDPFDPKSISDHPIKSLYSDNEGRLWVGTYNSGISIFDKRMNLFQHYYKKFNQNSVSHNNVTAFLSLNDGRVLIGTDGQGLSLFDVENEHFTNYQHDSRDPGTISNNKVKTMLMDSKDRVWIGLWNGGLDYFDQQKKTFTHIRKGKNKLSNDNVVCMAEDQDGYLWIGTFGGGLNKFNPDSLSFQYFNQDSSNSGSIRDQYIWSVLVDRQNNVWVGTSSGYLDVWDRKSETFMHLNIYEAEETSHSIKVLFEDAKGRIWIGTEGGGLKLLDKKNNLVQTFTTRHGLPSNNIEAIEEDAHGKLWISTNHGIVRFDPEATRWKSFVVSDGLQGLYFNRQASTSLASGELMFGGINGFNIFHPDSITKPLDTIPIVFTGFQIFNKPVPIGEKDSPLQAHINQTQAITLTYAQSVFSIEYAGLYYTDPNKVRYKYRLKGFLDESWQEVGNERKATYTNLHPGEYEFVVTTYGSNQEGGVRLQRTLSITVTPPWWQTWWVRLVSILLFGGVVFTAYYLRVRRIRKHNKRLEDEVTERTLKLQQANAALQQANEALHGKNLLIQEQKEEIQTQAEELVESNEEIRLINQRLEVNVEIRTADLRKSNQELDNFVYRVSHDIRAPLSSILGLVDLMEYEKDPQQLKAYLKMATKSIHKLDGFVKDILDYSRNTRMEVARQRVNFPELLKDVREELQYMENAARLKVIEEYQFAEVHYNDVRRLQIIFRNLFSNAIKYQNVRVGNSYLKIRVDTNDQIAQITVEDNGIGIDASQLTEVFNMFYRGSDLSNGSGIGLYIVKETVEKLGGSIDLQSQLGVGTTIQIQLPNRQRNLVQTPAGSVVP